MSDVDLAAAGHPAFALSSGEVFPPDLPVAVLRGALASGGPSYDAVVAEHVPLLPAGESCRSCGFVYTDRRICPALILAAAGYPLLADRVRVVPAADPEYRALCELTVEMARMGARLDVIGARVAPMPATKAQSISWWARLALADVFTDTFDPPTGDAERAGFCALMDALRRDDSRAVIIPTPEHLSRRRGGFLARRTIIEAEAGARLHIVRNTCQLP